MALPQELVALFAPFLRPPEESLVVAQLGQSLDGRIATESGHSHFVTGEDNIQHVHRLRALADAVIVGAGTVESDDPRLTCRLVEGPNPVRVVIDPAGRLDSRHHLFNCDAAPTLVVTRPGVQPDLPPAIDRVEVPSGEAGLDLAELCRRLRERGLAKLLVEGGGLTVSRFIAAGLVDWLHLAVAPMLIGSGRPALTLPVIDTLDQAYRPPVTALPMGSDMLFLCDLRRLKSQVLSE